MTWTIVFLFLIGIFILSGIKKYKEDKINDKEDNIVFTKQLVRYVTGFQEISGGDKVFTNIRVGKEKLFVEFVGKNIIKEISTVRITDVECSTSEDVARDVSLGKLLVFGVLAFGMKSNNKVVTKCAVIKYLDEFNKERTLIFETNPDELVKSIINVKRESKSGN